MYFVCLLTFINIDLQVMSGAHQSQGNIMLDICDGDLFATHPILQRNDKALQIVGYFDEVTVTNPIGSRAKKHKIGMYSRFINYYFNVYNYSN